MFLKIGSWTLNPGGVTSFLNGDVGIKKDVLWISSSKENEIIQEFDEDYAKK